MTERLDEIALLIVRENGKALTDAKAEATYAAEFSAETAPPDR